jgi:diguanylate cyclase (GGDEF)-like protein/PAS domain S-box-containing protein
VPISNSKLNALSVILLKARDKKDSLTVTSKSGIKLNRRISVYDNSQNLFWCNLKQWLCLMLALLSTSQSFAETTLTLGVFAYRPKEILLERYQPLADYLSNQLKTHRVVLRVLTQAEMEQAVEREELDFVFTNPSHYVLLRSQGRFTGALATLVSMESGKAADRLGGVIIANAEQKDIHTLQDLKHHHIAIPGNKFLGGYQTQAYELLQADIHVDKDVQISILGSHDKVIEAVLAGTVDAGFVRTGIIEELIKTDKLSPNALHIINQQHPQDFPYLVSTRLYPEWAFVATPKLAPNVIRKVASSLLILDESHPVSKKIGIGGFAPSGDYQEVDALSRTLRLPPYDTLPLFTLQELWQRWQGLWIGIILFITTILLFFVISLYRQNQQLRHAESKLQLAAKVFASAHEGIMITDTNGIVEDINAAFTHITGYSTDEIVGNNARILQSGLQDKAFYEAFWYDLKHLGGWSGVIWNKCKRGHIYAEKLTISSVRDTHGNIQHYAALFSDITQQKEDEDQLKYSAYHDSLTNLPNRALLYDRLRQAINQTNRNHTQIIVAIIDLDGFKAVNDSFGHKAGDELLIQFSERMCHTVREVDTVARLGGDEFVVVLIDIQPDSDVITTLMRLLKAASEPFTLKQHIAHVSGSIGYTRYPQAEDLSIEALLHQADEAMYLAKKSGKNRCQAYHDIKSI